MKLRRPLAAVGRFFHHTRVVWIAVGVYEVQYLLLVTSHRDWAALVMSETLTPWAVWICFAALAIAYRRARRAKKYWHEGHEKYDYALAAVTMLRHGKYSASRDHDEELFDVSCACGTYLGAVKGMNPDEIMPLLDNHTNVKIREAQAEVEEKVHAASGSR